MALDVAIWHDIPHAGWCPKARKAEDGILPAKYRLTETPSSSLRFPDQPLLDGWRPLRPYPTFLPPCRYQHARPGPRCGSYPLARSFPRPSPHRRTFPTRGSRSKQGHAFANSLLKEWKTLGGRRRGPSWPPRPTALGKKNWLFFGDAQAGHRSAILYTIIESCRCRSIDPSAYLRDVLTRLPSMTNWQLKHVTPEAWAKTSRSATQTAA
jgi:hypothetical protein